MGRSVVRKLLICLIFALVAIPLTPTSVAAQSQRTTLTFEDGQDGAVIGATIPGVQFTNTSGADWFYGDVRSGRYNAPYPLNCPDFGGVCAYAVAGFGFAWMGEAGGTGRIDFTAATATFFGAGFSTAGTLTVTAYAADDSALGSVTIAPNLRTGRLDRAEITTSLPIAYVLISGTENRWLMDDMVTDATVTLPPRPEPPEEPQEIEAGRAPAQVTVGVSLTPNIAVAPGEIATITLVVANRGRGIANDAILTLPFDPLVLSILNAEFSREGVWVSELGSGKIKIRTGKLFADGDTITITLRVRVLVEAPIGVQLIGRVLCDWDDEADNGDDDQRSNLPIAVTGPVNISADTLPLIVEIDAEQVAFGSSVFAPNEPIGVWYDRPDGVSVAVATLRADDEGILIAAIDLEDLDAGGGEYILVTQGIWSQVTLSGTFIFGTPTDS
ncbi:MAG: hypothetical protein HC822_09285 [Oscillochloris sp.]|nr:hypothetical protein [Oscillochloris sp.]